MPDSKCGSLRDTVRGISVELVLNVDASIGCTQHVENGEMHLQSRHDSVRHDRDCLLVNDESAKWTEAFM